MGNKTKFKFRRLAALLLALLMLCGCGKPASEPADPTANQQTAPSTPTDSTQPTDPTDPVDPEVPDDPEPLPELEAVTYLSCVEFDVFPELLSLGNGLVVACRNTYNSLQGRVNETLIVDIYNDQVVAQSVRAHSMELVTQKFSDGAILMAEPDSGKFFVFDQTLTAKSSFSAPNLDGFFSYDRSAYYFVDDEILYCMNVSSATVTKAKLERELRFESLLSIHPDQELLVARVYLSDHGTDCGLAVIDAQTGKLRLLRDDLTHVWLTEDRFSGVEMNGSYLSFDVYFGGLDGGDIQRIPTDQIYSGSVSYSVLPGSDYLLWRLNPDEGDQATKIYDLANGAAIADLTDCDLTKAVFSPIYLSQEQLIVGYYSVKEEKTEANPYPKESFYMVAVNPLKLTYGEGAAPEEASWQTTVDEMAVEDRQVTLNEDLKDLRDRADKLEKKYSVEILIGPEAEAACLHSGYSVAINEDPEAIASALDTLEQALAQYPTGFFGQMRNGAGEGGVSFCLTGAVKGGLAPVGFTQMCRDRYELVLDITAAELEATVHHELWHAIEMHLSADTFQTDAWNACNPADFAYYGSYDKGYRDLTKWTLDGGSGTNSCFVDGYGRINALEDRARIFERVMTGGAEDLLAAPMLKAKLQIMSDAIRAGFDTVGWTDIFWEQ